MWSAMDLMYAERSQPEQPRPHHPRQTQMRLRAPPQPAVSTFEQRNWMNLMAQNIFMASRPTMVLECTQGELNIRFCSTCNALWPLVGNPPTHNHHNKCENVNKFYPQKILPMFVCYFCNNQFTLHDIGKHVAATHFKVDINREVSVTHACEDCDTVIYSPLSEFIQHNYTAHGSFRQGVFAQFFRETLLTHLHNVLAVMGKLTEEFQQNGGRQTLMYACLFCKFVGREPHNRRSRCNFCRKSNNKFYCEHCNAIFSSSQIAYDIHRLTNQHINLMRNNQVASNAVRVNIDGYGRGHGGDRERGGSRGRSGSRGRGRGGR